ncbi:MAG: hypothetical protein GIX03_12365 [Candidatus Eremiobacteraeota bacterium]|nr:hypothetical protein [Candidatus Eremiobacteraeota bacterium]MBC5803758.1 hypothetical protein [Candidatus Eremiobacteraeota bacterium]MBC5822992.1 hypothetical protein [Candidatus Eremiobacteraeota bacterium]
MKERRTAIWARRWVASALGVGLVAAATGSVFAAGLRIVPIDPVPGAHVSSQRPAIEFEIHTADNASVNRRQVHVTLDGADVERDLQIAGSRLEIVPRDSLALGAHQVDVSVEDAAGERATDHWAFTIDASDAAVPTVSDDTSVNDGASTYDDGYGSNGSYGNGGYGYNSAYGYGYGYGGSYGYNGAFGLPYGYYPGSGAFFPVGYGPYYYGEPLRFIYTGFGLGGFVTVGGFPGTYPLVPFAPNYYFVTVPVPSYYTGGNPIAVCHFPHHRRYLLDSKPVAIEHAHRPVGSAPPAWVAPHWRPTLTTLATLPGTPVAVRALTERAVRAGSPLHSASSGPVIVRYGSGVTPAQAEPRIIRIISPDGPRVLHIVPPTSRLVAPAMPQRAAPRPSYAVPGPVGQPAAAPVWHAAPAAHAVPAAPAHAGSAVLHR